MGIFTRTGYNKKYLLTHPWELIFHYGRDLKWAWQRATKGYCFRDLWNINDWFIELIPRMLMEFKERNYSYPENFKTPDEWSEILDNMIFCFNEANPERCSLKNEYKYDCNFEFVSSENNSNFSTLHITYPTDADKKNSDLHYQRELELYDYREEKLKEGLNLFSKYFQDLWEWEVNDQWIQKILHQYNIQGIFVLNV